MLKDSFSGNSLPRPTDLEVKPNIEVNKILEFIDKNIESFPPYYISVKDTDRENRISDFLVHHFQLCKLDQYGGFLPYDFRKNPTQENSGKETDIGVFVMTKGQKPTSIIEFEAKRFSESSNNHEYVYGNRGGMERFKRGHHSAHIFECGMFAYVQSRSCKEWLEKTNSWITALLVNNSDTTIDWIDEQEKLVWVASQSKIDKYISINSRRPAGDKIKLWHYFIDLT